MELRLLEPLKSFERLKEAEQFTRKSTGVRVVALLSH